MVSWSRVWAAGALAVLAGLTGLAAAMTVSAETALGRFAAAGFTALLATAALRQVGLLWSPLRLFEADGNGIRTFLDGHRYGGRGFLVPWSAVTALELRVVHEQPGNRRRETVAVAVRPPLEVPSRVSYGGDSDGGRVLHLDAGTGDLRGARLLAALRGCMRRWGG